MPNATVETSNDSRAATLVDRYLACWSEPDADRRAEALKGCWTEDGSLFDPPIGGSGIEEISAVMEAMQAHYPGHRFLRTTLVDVHHDAFRVGWELLGPDGSVALAGVDFGIVTDDGRLSAVRGFFNDLTTDDGRDTP